MRPRIFLVAAVATLAVGLIGVPAASAARSPTVPPLYTVKNVHGASKNGKQFQGTYGIQRFIVAKRHGTRGVYAIGTLKGKLNGHRINKQGVMMPAKLNGPSSTLATAAQAICPVLHLVLGPINLNLLGLQVTLGGGNIKPGQQAQLPITLNLTAHQGGGLLGDLLCGVSNLLNANGLLGQLTGHLTQVTATLNSLISLLGGGA
jgi:hypothetical protein